MYRTRLLVAHHLFVSRPFKSERLNPVFARNPWSLVFPVAPSRRAGFPLPLSPLVSSLHAGGWPSRWRRRRRRRRRHRCLSGLVSERGWRQQYEESERECVHGAACRARPTCTGGVLHDELRRRSGQGQLQLSCNTGGGDDRGGEG